MNHMLPKVSRAGAWGCIVLLAYLSLTPWQARTGAGGVVEHLVAYAGTSALFALGYPARRPQAVWGLTAFGAILELLQAFVPGRSAALITPFVNGGGVVLGTVMATILMTQYRRRRASSAKLETSLGR
jgi:VanZ family protein